MILDASAIIAVLRNEPDAAAFAQSIASAEKRSISAVNYLEAAIVMDGSRDPVVSRRFDDFIEAAAIAIVPVTGEHALIAREAYRDFGKGSGHRANLNFGDCFAYAVARASREPLLFKGNDFGFTDVESVVR